MFAWVVVALIGVISAFAVCLAWSLTPPKTRKIDVPRPAAANRSAKLVENDSFEEEMERRGVDLGRDDKIPKSQKELEKINRHDECPDSSEDCPTDDCPQTTDNECPQDVEASAFRKECPKVCEDCPETGNECPEACEDCSETGKECPEAGKDCPEACEDCPETGKECPEACVDCPKAGKVCPEVGEGSSMDVDESAKGSWEDEREYSLEGAAAAKEEGNVLYREKKFVEAVTVYSRGLEVCPLEETTLAANLFFNRSAGYMESGDDDAALSDCSEAIRLNESYVKAYVRRCRLLEKKEKWHDALQDVNKVMELEPTAELQKKQIVIEQHSKAQFEKEKEEMVGKLKDFGNWALGKVGLSMENFKVEQNVDSGSYNIQFVQNAAK